MPRKRDEEPFISSDGSRPALSEEARENRMISLAIDRAEQQLLDGTASSQVITHYLKLASMREKMKLENDILERQKELITAKTEQLKSAKRVEELYADAMKAFREYSGQDDEEDISDEEYY